MKKNNIVLKLVFGILAVVEFIFFIVGIILLVSSIRFQEEAVEVSAEITQIESYRDIDGDILIECM